MSRKSQKTNFYATKFEYVTTKPEDKLCHDKVLLCRDISFFFLCRDLVFLCRDIVFFYIATKFYYVGHCVGPPDC